MTFEKGQSIYFIYKVKVKKRNSHKWKVKQGIVSQDNVMDPRVEIENEKGSAKKVKRRYIFLDRYSAESKCENWNQWGKYHKNVDYRGKRRKR